VRLGVVLSVQSDFNALPDEKADLGTARVGEANATRVYAWDRLRRAGATLLEGSDYFGRPGAAMAPFLATLTRRYAAGSSLPDHEARVLAWRLNSARAGTDGALRSGAPADFLILGGNPFTSPRSAIESIRIHATFHDGRPVMADSGLRRALARP